MKSPLEHLGFNVGDDYKLADWSQIVAYFEHLIRTAENIAYVQFVDGDFE